NVRPTNNISMRNRTSSLWALAVLAIGSLTLGCRDPRPRSLAVFDGCLAGGIESLRQGEQTIQVECEVPETLSLVGLPGREITVGELTTLGLSKDIADTLATSSLKGSRWCAVEEFEYTPPTPNDKRSEIPIATTNCSTTDLEIQQLVHIRASKMRVTLMKLTSG